MPVPRSAELTVKPWAIASLGVLSAIGFATAPWAIAKQGAAPWAFAKRLLRSIAFVGLVVTVSKARHSR
jgi:hypothetical protein